jgi:hypothetical protein
MSSLYNLRQDYQILLEQLYDSEVSEEILLDTLDSIEGAIEDKAENYGKILRQIGADIKRIKEEERRLEKRRKSLENNMDFLKHNLYSTMKTIGLSEIKTPLFSFNIQANGGKRALVLDVTVEELPECFRKIEYKADTEALRQWLSGAEDNCPFCHLEEQGEHLRIR